MRMVKHLPMRECTLPGNCTARCPKQYVFVNVRSQGRTGGGRLGVHAGESYHVVAACGYYELWKQILLDIISAISVKGGRKEICYLTMHSTHFIYSYVALDIW